MTLRLRLSVAFALIALGTAAAIALATPYIVGRGFARLESALASPASTGGQGPGSGGAGAGPRGPMAGIHAGQIQDDTTLTIVVVALAAASIASLVGLLVARELTRPIRRLEQAAATVAEGDLASRSGIADRGDELGALGRSFDAMADGLERADHTRRRFLQDVVHELRTPLTVIEATTSAVLDGVYEHDPRHLETVRDQARLLSRIVADLRTISLAEGGGLPLATTRVDVPSLLAEIGRAFETRAVAGGLVLSVDRGDAPALEADPDRVRQVIGALLDNAIRHTPRGGRVEVTATADDGSVRFSVHDSGGGFAAVDLPHVFDRFYQADAARDRATGTSGLGLAIVRALVVAQGGQVGAANDPAGGAVVWFTLPVARS